ncbi:MAG: ABC transporter permease [Acidobacteriaceae bacterium]|nr:ABC transporter permease [Acidobacteriaceae bacterium]
MTTPRLLESSWQDLRFGARLLRLNKGFFLVAVVSLALGIGANTALFQLLDSLRLRLLPVSHPEELARLEIAKNDHCCSGNFASDHSDFTYPQWEQIRDHQQAFASLFAWSGTRFNLSHSGEVHFAQGLWVTGDFFKTLGLKPLLGRLISSDDDRPGCGSPGVVISYPFWERQFAGDSAVLGKQLSLNGRRFDIMGVAPPGFFGVEVGSSFEVAVPACAEFLVDGEGSHLNKRDHWWLAITGRLKPGWTVARAAAQVAAISPQVFGATVPPNYRPDTAKYYARYKLTALPGGYGVSDLREHYQQPVLLLLAIAGLVLLIACCNLANLLLARASAREREMAVRLAIGASRGRLIRQLLLECLLLTLIGAALGALLAQFLCRYLLAFLSSGNNPLFLELSLDWRVLGFTAAVALVTCLLFGLTPAVRATRAAPASAMKTSSRGLTADRQRLGLGRALVIGQVALSLVLLLAALLFARSLRYLLTLDAGFRQNGLLVTNVNVSSLNLPPRARGALFRQILDRLRHAPGIDAAASARLTPVGGGGWNELIEFTQHSNQKRQLSWFNSVGPGYFGVMGTPLLAGRDFDQRDSTSTPPVAVVNEEFVKKYLVGANPLGAEFRVLVGPGEPEQRFLIVGVVKDAKYLRLQEDFMPTVFVADTQDKEPRGGINFIVHSTAALGPLMANIKKSVLEANPGASLEFTVFKTQLRDSLLRERLIALLSGFFGFLAVLLATVGLYGVVSYMVVRRRNEIGIRIALGADRTTIANLIVKEAGLLLGLGLAIGIALALATARTAASFLYGLRPNDPASIALAIASLALIALLASFVPAMRAARVEPIIALREE